MTAKKKKSKRPSAKTKNKSAPAPATLTVQVPNTLSPKVQAALEPLSLLERRFVIYFCGRARGNAKLAAKLAGVQPGKFGGTAHKSTLQSRAWQLEHDGRVRVAIDAWMEEFALSKARVTAALIDLTEVNPGPFTRVNKNGSVSLYIRHPDEWAAHRHWVKSIDVDPVTGRISKLTLHDRHAALRDLAKIMGLQAPEQHNHFHLYADMTDDELKAAIEQDAAALLGPGSPPVIEAILDEDDASSEDHGKEE